VADGPYPFAHAFAHGDYLLFALLLLIETGIESDHLFHEKVWLETLRNASLLMALIFTLLFAGSKWDMTIVLPTAAEALRHQRMSVYAVLNCCAAGVAILMGLVSFYTVCDIEDTEAVTKATTNE
jgi:uncharacterized membrane protein